jgi:CheY-like chemotaxis protein
LITRIDSFLEPIDSSEDFRKRKILLVDDQAYNIDALLIILKRKLGLNPSEMCSVAFNGKQALEKVKENMAFYENKECSYKLILMDLNMPIMDGYEASLEIRSVLSQNMISQPIICAVTGHYEPEFVEKCKEYQMDCVFSKPIDINGLTDVIKSLNLE